MNIQAIISQLEKALKTKDDKELRLRVEILLEFLRDTAPPVQPVQPIEHSQPLQTFDYAPIPNPTAEETKPAVNKITTLREYKRPKGT